MLVKGEDFKATHLKKAVNDSHSHVHGLLQQAELKVHLNEPVNENGPHVTSHLLTLQIGRSDILLHLKWQETGLKPKTGDGDTNM